jgi:RNA recognition motif-containing protein
LYLLVFIVPSYQQPFVVLAAVGPVKFSEIYTDDQGKSKGSGVIEFETVDLAEEAIKKMHRHEVKGRRIIVRRDLPEGGGRGRRDDSPDRHDRQVFPFCRAIRRHKN